MNPLKRLVRFILREEIENNNIHFEKLVRKNLGKADTIGELRKDVETKDDEINRLKLKCEQMRQEILDLKKKRPHFKRKQKKGRYGKL